MKITIDGISYEGTVDEFRELFGELPFNRRIAVPDFWGSDFPRRWDSTPIVTCSLS